MEINTFLDHFALQFDGIERSKLSADTKFRDLDGWSSFLALSIIAMVDEEYNIAIKGDDISNSETIDDLFKIVNSKL